MNKGLTNISSLKSINIITKAQIALSTRINDNVSRLYNQFVEEDKKGKYDIEKSRACLAELHKAIVNPDDLTPDKSDDYVDILGINNIETYIAEKALLENQILSERERLMHEKEALQRKRDEEKTAHENENKKNNAAIEKAAFEILENRNSKKQSQFQESINRYYQEKTRHLIDAYKAEKKKNVRIVIIYSIIVLVLYLLSVTIVKYNGLNNILFFIATIVGFLLFAIPFIRPLIRHEKITSAFLFCFSKNQRKKILEKIEKDYVALNPEPVVELYTIDEIIKELKSVN